MPILSAQKIASTINKDAQKHQQNPFFHKLAIKVHVLLIGRARKLVERKRKFCLVLAAKKSSPLTKDWGEV
jgi:hypothetical protein